jgi:hypothetical protein
MRSIFLLFLFLYCVNSYKILFYNPKFGISHVNFVGKIADTLATAGHDVVVYQPVLNENITFCGTKHKNVRYYTMPKNYSLEFTSASQGNVWEGESSASMQKMFKVIRPGFCELVMNDIENLKKLQAENFDLGLTELFDPCGFGVFAKIGLKKYITAFGSSLFPPSASLLGIKLHPSYIPGVFSAKTDRMNFFDRVQNFFTYFIENLWIKQMLTAEIEKVIQKTLPNFDMDVSVLKLCKEYQKIFRKQFRILHSIM